MAIKIFVDQGHNPEKVNAGAEGFGLREQDITYNVGIYLADMLRKDKRFEVKLSRNSPDEILGNTNTQSLSARVSAANQWGADYFLSIHANANANVNEKIDGTEAYIYKQGTQSAYLAQDILDSIVKMVGTRDNGVRVNSSLYVLRRTKMPAVLIELAYITNQKDSILLKKDQRKFAKAIYYGILSYLGLE